MTQLKDICNYLNDFAPTRYAEDWDNVGLLVGDRDSKVSKIMACLTVTPETASEAIARNADLIVTHHPLPFRPVKKLTTDTTSTRMLWDLIRAGVAIYSPHTGFDSAASGINQMICQKLNLEKIQPLSLFENENELVGAGRFGQLPKSMTLEELLAHVKTAFGIAQIQYVGQLTQQVIQVASACGAGGSFIDKVIQHRCHAFITGETNFHTCLEAKAQGIALILTGHYASERFAIEELVKTLLNDFSDLDIWAAVKESDPVDWA